MKKLINTNDITLRQRAEELHKKKRSVSESKLSEFDTLKLIHELEVHQIELEMQNEEVMLSRNQAELATEKYAELYDFAPSCYFTLSEKGNIIDLNLSGSEMLGKERSHLKNRSFSFFVSNDTRPIFNHFLGKVFKSKIKETCEVNFSNNGSLPMNAHLTGIVTKNGEQCLVTVIDITERKRAEEALRESEEKYRVLFEGSTLGIFAADVETHRILYFNPVICRIFGYSGEEFLRLTIPDLHPKDSMDLVISNFESLMRGDKVVSSALPCLRKDGTVFYADIAGNPTIINGRKCSVAFFLDVTMRKQAEEAHKQANSELQNLHNNLDLAVFSVDVIHNKMLQVSVAHEAMFGYSQEAFFNNTMLWYEIIVPEDKLIVDAGYPVLFSGKNLHHEYRIVHADGQIRWIEAKMKPTIDTNGKLIRIDGIASNITERKRLEETLRESKAKYQTIFESTGTATFVIDEDTTILMANNECYSIMGYTPSELIGQKYSQYVAPESLQEILNNQQLRRQNPDLAPKKYEVKLVSIKGEILSVILDIGMIPGTKQSIVSILDITERKRAEEALRKSEENLGKMVANIGDVIVIIDQNGINRYKSPNIEKWFGWRPEEVIGFSVWENIHPDELNSVQKIFGALLGKPNAIVTTECRYRCKDGSYKWIEFTGINLLHDPDIQGILGNYHDITERKRAEETMDQERILLRTIIDNFPNSILVKDKKYRKIIVNLEHARRVTAHQSPAIPFSVDDLLGKTDFEVYPRELAEEFLIEDQKVIEGGQSVLDQELLSIDANGQSHWELISKIPLRDRNGEIIGLVVISNDITERKRAEEELRESKVKYQEIFETTGTATFIIEEDTTIHMANNECYSIMGYTPSELIGQKWSQYVAPESLPEMLKNHQLRRQNPDLAPKKYDVKLVNKKGGKRDIILNIAMISGTKQSIISLIDITERKRAEEELNEAKEFTESTLNSITDIFYSFDLSGKFLNWNKTFSRISGYSDEELSSKKPMDFFSGEGIQRIAEAVERIYKEGTARVDADFVIKNGRQIPCEFTGSVLKDGKGNIIGFSGTARDITERRQAELAIAHSHELMHYIIEHSQSAIAVHDRDLRYIYVSQRYLKEFKVKEKDVIGKHLYEALPDLPQKWRDVHQKALAGEVSSADDDSYEKEDGTIEWTRWECRPWYEANGSVGGFIIYSEVITERKKKELELFKAKEKAEEGDRLKSAFLANMSHEVRTPLNSIIGFSELLADPFFEEEQKNEFIQSIIISGNNLLTIISDIMDISKMQSDEITIRKKQINVHKFVSTLKGLFSFETNGNEFELILPDNDEETLVFADVERFRQIFNNLIDNAIKFTSNGKIEIGYLPKDKMVEFFVKDTGIGIPAEYHDTIFERFRQVEAEKTRKYGGNGLGLAITKNLVELMGGKIWLKSESGKGSVFYFTLPTYNSEI